MTIKLEKLVSSSKIKSDATIIFDMNRTLILGPSDTGKSYIRDCLWYLLGGKNIPKNIPENASYDTLLLQINFNNKIYTIKKSLKNDSLTELYQANISNINEKNIINQDIGSFLVECSGAKDKIILRSKSKNGPINGSDLRHWFLLSQPAMISENPTYGTSFTERTQRKASFYTFLTGLDDSDMVLDQSEKEKTKIKTSLDLINKRLITLKENLPDDFNQEEVNNSLIKLDRTLDELSNARNAKTQELKNIRIDLSKVITLLNENQSKLIYAEAMLSRLKLLNQKYENDLDRLNAIDSSLAIFNNLEPQACILCGSISNKYNEQLSELDIIKQRNAIAVESKKIKLLKQGLLDSIKIEEEIVEYHTRQVKELDERLIFIRKQEEDVLSSKDDEISFDIKELALKRTEYSLLLNTDREIQKLVKEHDNFNSLIKAKSSPITRKLGEEFENINILIRSILHSWGFSYIESIQLDIMECDIQIDGRARLSYGAGLRSIFLAALAIGFLSYSIDNSHPNLGFLIIDSPLKAYGETKNSSDVTVPVKTVKNSFYEWLSNWKGNGQLIVLENEPVNENIYAQLKPIQFTGTLSSGRYGFYPK